MDIKGLEIKEYARNDRNTCSYVVFVLEFPALFV